METYSPEKMRRGALQVPEEAIRISAKPSQPREDGDAEPVSFPKGLTHPPTVTFFWKRRRDLPALACGQRAAEAIQ